MTRLLPAFEGHEVILATVDRRLATSVRHLRFHRINVATRWNKFGLVRQLLLIAGIVLRERPDVVVSTGAAPGFFALRLGKLLGARTIWLDSIANVEKLSTAGEKAGRCADLWLTQWEHLARPGGPQYRGGVL